MDALSVYSRLRVQHNTTNIRHAKSDMPLAAGHRMCHHPQQKVQSADDDIKIYAA
jgi:hypothetical protein